jgi:hypothetical protein
MGSQSLISAVYGEQVNGPKKNQRPGSSVTSSAPGVSMGEGVTPGAPRDHPGSPGAPPTPYAHPSERERQYLVDVLRVLRPLWGGGG